MTSKKTGKGDLPKRLVRELQEIRGWSYSACLNELRNLPPDTDLRAYLDRVAENVKAGVPQ